MTRGSKTRRVNQRRTKKKPYSVRSKLDPRLSFILSLSQNNLKRLVENENEQITRLSEEIQSVGVEQDELSDMSEQLKKIKDLQDKLFAPITSGIYFPANRRKKDNKRGPVDFRKPYASAFILSDASSKDLTRLGIKVRSQAGDIFSVFVPLSTIPKLEASSAIRFIELARPLFTTLNQAIPFTQINVLQSAMPPINGSGVIVGVIDNPLDIYHPDFRTVANATRVLFLWDQSLRPQGTEAGPPTAPTLPGFIPTGGTTYGVEYSQASINNELNNFNPPATPAYQTVRHSPPNPPINTVNGHGTLVTGCAAGNGLGQAGTFTGAAPNASIIFVRPLGVFLTSLAADNTAVLDAFAYIFARASQLGQACVVNLSSSDNQGPHDGTTLGEQFLDNLLLTPGRAITLSAGNSNNTASHAAGNVQAGATTNLILNYTAGAVNSDDIEIWYDGHDRFTTTVTIPTAPATTVGPVAPGSTTNVTLPTSNIQIQVSSVLADARNGDNLISIIITRPPGQNIPAGNWTIALTGTTIINGSFQAWVDRNNRGRSAWQPPFLQENQLTLGIPSTARRPITVGNHDKTAPTPNISGSSGCGPSRDGRIKPEIATIGTNVTAPSPRNMNSSLASQLLYQAASGTSFSAPLTAGACALLFQCRGATSTWANLKQILEDTAGTTGLNIPHNAFGFGFMQMGNACVQPGPNVDVWIRDDITDTGMEPFTGPVAWLSPDIEVLDSTGNPVPNPTYNPSNRFNNIIRITVRNRGTQIARNTEVYLYWADPGTNLPFPATWNSTGIYTDGPGFLTQTNKIVIPQLVGGSSVSVQFAWAPPAPGSNLRGDNHFCLLARLENEGDSSNIGVGGWPIITAKNNIGLHNVLVQPASDSQMSFYVIGSYDQDSLIIYTELVSGKVSLNIPIQALPWRDIQLIERYTMRRQVYGCGTLDDDPLAKMKVTLKGEEIQIRTDIIGAEMLELNNGVASILVADKEDRRLFIPNIRLAEGVKMPAIVYVHDSKINENKHFVHIAQLSGGQLVGGVTLELRKEQERS